MSEGTKDKLLTAKSLIELAVARIALTEFRVGLKEYPCKCGQEPFTDGDECPVCYVESLAGYIPDLFISQPAEVPGDS